MELMLEKVEEFACKIFAQNRSISLLPQQSAKRDQQNNILPIMTSSTRGDIDAVSAIVASQKAQILNETDWKVLHELLREDFRYRHMNKLHQVRENMMKQVNDKILC